MKIKTSSLYLALYLVLAGAAPMALFTGCAGDRYDRSTGEYIDDKALAMRVKDALGDNPEYKFDDVNVSTFRGEVQLSGFVNTADQKSKAATVARGVRNVKDVINNITIMKESDRTPGEYVDDKKLSAKVHSALSDNPAYKLDTVSVNCYRGTVQLYGFVNTAELKRKAGNIAAEVEGAKKVENNITVKEN